MKRRIIILLAALSIGVSVFSGCGCDSKDANATPDSAVSSTTALKNRGETKTAPATEAGTTASSDSKGDSQAADSSSNSEGSQSNNNNNPGSQAQNNPDRDSDNAN